MIKTRFSRWLTFFTFAAAVALAISIGLNYYFVYGLHKNAAWLALTTSVVTTFNFLFYFLYLRRQLGGVDGRTLVSGLGRILAAGALLGAVCWAGKTWFLQGFLDWSFPARLLGISLVCGCAGIVYLAAAFLFKTPELDAVRLFRLRLHLPSGFSGKAGLTSARRSGSVFPAFPDTGSMAALTIFP